MHTKAVLQARLMLQASCSLGSLSFWGEKGPDHLCGFQKSLFKSQEKNIYISMLSGEEEIICKQAEKNDWTRLWFYALWSLVLARSFKY